MVKKEENKIVHTFGESSEQEEKEKILNNIDNVNTDIDNDIFSLIYISEVWIVEN